MLEIRLNEHTVEDLKAMEELQKMGVPDDIINLGYHNTLKAREKKTEREENDVL